MKTTILFLFLLTLCCNVMKADFSPIIIQNGGGGGHDHSEYYEPADMPEVYYDSDGMEIIIIADGFASYYNVVIIRNSTNQTMVSTQISGYGDTIDISSFPSDNYMIVITSEYNNVFQGNFTII